MEYISIATAKVWDELMPTEIELPVTVDLGQDEEEIHASDVIIVRRGDSDWDDQLGRWMFLQGYVAVQEEEEGRKGGIGLAPPFCSRVKLQSRVGDWIDHAR